MNTRPLVQPEQMCRRHQRELVAAAGYTDRDPWRSLIIGAQIALFQAATADDSTHERIGGDITRINELGCLACYKPDAFASVAKAAKTRDLGVMKALGESWVKPEGRS